MKVTQAEYAAILEKFNALARYTLDGLDVTVFDAWFEPKYNIGPWLKARIEVYP